MWIKSFNISNFRAFRESSVIYFRPGMNVIVGRNNSGKSALLDALNLPKVTNRPFLGDLTRVPIEESSFEMEIVASGPEIIQKLRRFPPNDDVNIPVPVSWKNKNKDFIEHFFSLQEIKLRITAIPQRPLETTSKPSHQLCASYEIIDYERLDITRDGEVTYPGIFLPSEDDNLPRLLTEAIYKSIFVFQAQRLVSATHRFERNELLDSIGANLPAALMTMQGEQPRAFEQLKVHLRSVIPEITNLTLNPIQEGNIDIRIWTEAFAPHGEEISMSLAECGTGVGQVLALLQVAMSSGPTIIAVDEPNSFLHPGASKQLLRILASYDNQYIITTIRLM